jgi:hypothetical protein
VKQKADETAPLASVNMVFILPMEFKAADNDEGVEEQVMAQLTLDHIAGYIQRKRSVGT